MNSAEVCKNRVNKVWSRRFCINSIINVLLDSYANSCQVWPGGRHVNLIINELLEACAKFIKVWPRGLSINLILNELLEKCANIALTKCGRRAQNTLKHQQIARDLC